MKILHIIDSSGLYGAEIVLLNLVDEQIKLGIHPTIASIGEKHIEEKPLETEALKRGFKVKKFRMFPGPNLPGMWKVLRYAQEHGFDILHSHGYKGNVAFGLMPKKLRKLPLISTLHGYTSVSGISKNRIYEWLDLISFKRANSVVLVNRGMMSNPRLRKLKGEKIHIVNNGIPIPDDGPSSDLHTFSSSISLPSQRPSILTSSFQSPSRFNNSTIQLFDKEIKDFCSKGFTIGSIGRLSTEKGYRYLIEAFSLLIKRNKPNQPANHLTHQPINQLTDARLVIIGEGYERGLLEELIARLGLKDRILLPGYRDKAKYYIPYFKAFVISSLTEGLPITLLEAMQAKIPIIATRVGGIPEVLQDGNVGLLVEPRRPDAIAQAVMALHSDEKLADELTGKAYHRVIIDFSSKTMAQKYLDLYSRLINLNCNHSATDLHR